MSIAMVIKVYPYNCQVWPEKFVALDAKLAGDMQNLLNVNAIAA